MADVEKEVTNGVQGEAEEHNTSDHEHDKEHDPHYEPIISLPEVPVVTLEEEEDDLVKLRAKLFRFDKSEEPHQWKERGTGEIKILRHKERNTVRVLMRRDKTLKICANHYVRSWMHLEPNCDSDRAWVWSVEADYADEVAKSELLAVRFANAENATKFKEAFEEAKKIAGEEEKKYGVQDHEEEEEESEEEEEEEAEETETKEEAKEETKEDQQLTERLSSLKVNETEKE